MTTPDRVMFLPEGEEVVWQGRMSVDPMRNLLVLPTTLVCMKGLGIGVAPRAFRLLRDPARVITLRQEDR